MIQGLGPLVAEPDSRFGNVRGYSPYNAHRANEETGSWFDDIQSDHLLGHVQSDESFFHYDTASCEDHAA